MTNIKLEEQLLSRVKFSVQRKNIKIPNAAIPNGAKADEYQALTLFSNNMKEAAEGLQLTIDNPAPPVSFYIYSASIVLYRQLFKGCSGISRDKSNIKLINGKIRNPDGSEKKDDKGVDVKIMKDRFYVEEFFKHPQPEFLTHIKMIDQADKFLCHFDKVADRRAIPILVFEGNKPVDLVNYFEKFLFNKNDLEPMRDTCIQFMNLANHKLQAITNLLFDEEKSKSLPDYDESQIISLRNLQR